MAVKRRQQKLLGFGTRWQGADPLCAVGRHREVAEALANLRDGYAQQAALQGRPGAECVAVYDAAARGAVLLRRRGQAIGSFGRREAGRWVLEPEETLYLAERATLAVFAPAPAPADSHREGEACEEPAGASGAAAPPPPGSGPDAASAADGAPAEAADDVGEGTGLPAMGRRLTVQELYRLVLGDGALGLDAFSVYAHLRRAGFAPSRLRAGEADEVGGVPAAAAKRRRAEGSWAAGAPAGGSGSEAAGETWLALERRAAAVAEPGGGCADCWQVSRADRAGGTQAVHVVGPDEPLASLAAHAAGDGWRGGGASPAEALRAALEEGGLIAVANAGEGNPIFLEFERPRPPGLPASSQKKPSPDENRAAATPAGSEVPPPLAALAAASPAAASAPSDASPAGGSPADDALTGAPPDGAEAGAPLAARYAAMRARVRGLLPAAAAEAAASGKTHEDAAWLL